MQKDPVGSVYATVQTAELTAQVTNALIEKLSWKSIPVISIFIFGSISSSEAPKCVENAALDALPKRHEI